MRHIPATADGARRAMTLVELIISVAIGVLLIALSVQALIVIRRTVIRAETLTVLHDEAATIHREVGDCLQSLHPGALWSFDADPGKDGIWGPDASGNCDDRVSLTWMSTVTHKEARTYTLGRDWAFDLAWARLTWIGGGANGKPSLQFARSNGFRTLPTVQQNGNAATIDIFPQFRRDRQRDLNDDDLRLVPGFTGTPGQGDGDDLNAQLAPLHGPNTRVVACAISWLDRGGHRVGWDSRSGTGLVAYAPTGTAESLPGVTSTHAGLDGLWLDGHITTATVALRSVDQEHPLLVRLSVTLADDPDPANPALRANAATATFDFSFPVDPVLGGYP